jgi:glutamate synthase (NADPH/NADH) small chain
MDHAYAAGARLIERAGSTGRRIAIVGSGPAGLSCAGELSRRGHDVVIFERRDLGGGLSTYGIISLREPIEASLKEVKMIESLGARIETGAELGANIALDDLRSQFDAVFLGLGLGATPEMGIEGEEHLLDGLKYIEHSKLAPVEMNIGRNVAVIGAGNTAIDCATVAKRLGAAKVTMIYRRSAAEMTAYPHEYDFIKKEGVEFLFLAQPVAVLTTNGRVTALRALRTEPGPPGPNGRRTAHAVPGSEFTVAADQIVKATGQEKPSLAERLGLTTDRGYIKVDAAFETSIPNVFAGGDCIRAKNTASTVMAVQDGKLAAIEIHRRLSGQEAHGRP